MSTNEYFDYVIKTSVLDWLNDREYMSKVEEALKDLPAKRRARILMLLALQSYDEANMDIVIEVEKETDIYFAARKLVM